MSEADTLAGSRKSRLRITEIFYSLQGESRPAGYPTAFIRLTGCPLRCHYCDTEYAFHGGRVMEIADIIQAIATYQAKFVCVTGGEPLAQPNCLGLLTDLCDLDYRVSLETSGALDIAEVDQRVNIVMDIKTPASGEHARNRWENLEHELVTCVGTVCTAEFNSELDTETSGEVTGPGKLYDLGDIYVFQVSQYHVMERQ